MNKLTVKSAVSQGLIQKGDTVEIRSSNSNKVFKKTVARILPDNTFECTTGHTWGNAELIKISSRAGGYTAPTPSTPTPTKLTVSGAIMRNLIQEGDIVKMRSSKSGKVFERICVELYPNYFLDEKNVQWDSGEFIDVVDHVDNDLDNDLDNLDDDNIDDDDSNDEYETPRASDRLRRATLDPITRKLQDEGLEDEEGKPTEDAKEYVLELLTEKHWDESRKEIGEKLIAADKENDDEE